MFNKIEVNEEVRSFAEFISVSMGELCLTGTTALVVHDMAAACSTIDIEVTEERFSMLKSFFPNCYGVMDLAPLEEEGASEMYEEFIQIDDIYITIAHEHCSEVIEMDDDLNQRSLEALFGFKDWLQRERSRFDVMEEH